MKSFNIAATAALLSTASASTISFTTTECLHEAAIQEFFIPFHPSEAVAISLPKVCGLDLVGASPDLELSNIQCQAFRDAAGTIPGSKVFMYEHPAQIATNPIQEQALRCSYIAPPKSLAARQEEQQSSSTSAAGETTTATNGPTFVTLTPISNPSRSARSTRSISSVASSASPVSASASDAANSTTSASISASSDISTIVSTVTAPSNSSAIKTTGSPSATQSGPSPSQSSAGAAKGLSVGLGVVGAAVVAMLF